MNSLLVMVMFLGTASVKVGSEVVNLNRANPAGEPKKAQNELSEEVKALQEAVAKLQGEIRQLRNDFKVKEVQEREATEKYVRVFTDTYLESVAKKSRLDAANMLSKSLRGSFGNETEREDYAAPLAVAGHGFDGAEWKSWTIDSQDWAPNRKSVIIRGNVKGKNEAKEVSLSYSMQVVYESESELWKISMFRIDFRK